MASKNISSCTVSYTSSNENWFARSTNTVLATKFPRDFIETLLCFPTNCSKCCCIYTLFSTCDTRWKLEYLCICLLLICIKGKLVLRLDKTGYVSHGTRPKFIDSQNFYRHFHYKLFCFKAVHLFDKLSLMCPRLWPMQDICIGLYVRQRLLNVRHILEKSYVNDTQFVKSFQKNKEELNWSLLEIL